MLYISCVIHVRFLSFIPSHIGKIQIAGRSEIKILGKWIEWNFRNKLLSIGFVNFYYLDRVFTFPIVEVILNFVSWEVQKWRLHKLSTLSTYSFCIVRTLNNPIKTLWRVWTLHNFFAYVIKCMLYLKIVFFCVPGLGGACPHSTPHSIQYYLYFTIFFLHAL